MSSSTSSIRRSPRLAPADHPADGPEQPLRDAAAPPASPASVEPEGESESKSAPAETEAASATPPPTDGVRRSPRIASRVRNPRLLMRQWLDGKDDPHPPRARSPSPLLSRDRSSSSRARGSRAASAPPRSRSPSPASDASQMSPHETVRTADTMSEDEESDEFEPPRARSPIERKRLERLFDADDGNDDDDAEGNEGGDYNVGSEAGDDAAEWSEDDAVLEDDAKKDPIGSASMRFVRDRTKRPKRRAKAKQQRNEKLVSVPALKKVHKDWNSFSAYLNAYQIRTHQAIRREDVVSVARRNNDIANTVAARNGMHVMFVPTSWENYKVTFICTHGWKPRVRKIKRADGEDGGEDEREKQKRNMRFLRGTLCPFRFVATVKFVDDEWLLVITAEYLFHNHPVGPEVFKTYAENRGVQDPDNMATVTTMMENERKPRAILHKLLEKGENVTRKDVENMVYAYNTEIKKEDDDAACLSLLATYTAADEHNLVTVDETSKHESGVISISSGFMVDMRVRFGRMLLVDCTHKTNRYNYQLLTLMTIDEYGEGTVVQHSLLERNADWHMSRALDHYVRANPDCAEQVQIIMVDKDLNEIKILRVYFPRARILICIFHVLKYLKRMVRKPEFGALSGDDRDTLDAIVHKLVYAESKEIYEESRAVLRDVCTAIGFEKFFEYFEANWHTCIDMWVMYTRASLPHFRVHTNNHLESYFGHLKESVKPTMGMKETVEALINDDRARQNEYIHRHVKVGHYYNHAYDDAMNELLRFTNPFIAKHVETEYTAASNKVSVFEYDETSKPGFVSVKCGTEVNDVDTRAWTCTCTFSLSMQLPCQHAIAFRKRKGDYASIPLSAVQSRWLGAPEQRVAPSEPRLKFTAFSATAKKRKLTPQDKYRAAVRATEALCAELADITDDEEFNDFLAHVVDEWRSVRQRKRVKRAGTEDQHNTDSNYDESDLPASVPTQPSQLSQAHSLYSDELGHVNLVAPVPLPVTGDLIAESQCTPDVSGAAEEMDGDEDHDPDFVSDAETRPPARISLNPRAAKSAWKTTRAVTLEALADALDEDQPSISETASRLQGLRVRHYDDSGNKVNKKKPTYARLKAPVLNHTAFYLLPNTMLDKCFAVLPLSNKKDDAIPVFSQSQSQESQESDAGSGRQVGKATGQQLDAKKLVECVKIANLGTYSRAQVEAMRRLSTLKENCEYGYELCKWLRRDVSAFTFDGRPSKIAAEIEAKYPYATIPGFKSDYTYRLLPQRWLSDALIAAFCDRLCMQAKNVRYMGVLVRSPRGARGAKQPLPDALKTRLTDAALEVAPDGVLILPVNFLNAHWTVVLILLEKKEILYYDSLGKTASNHTLNDVAQDVGALLFKLLSVGFKKTCVDNPQQFDGYSCGVFICHKIATTIDASVVGDSSADADSKTEVVTSNKPMNKDLSSTALTNFRFRLLAFVLHGEKL